MLKLIPFLLLSGCAALPSILGTVEDIAEDQDVQVVVDKEVAMCRHKNVHIVVDVNDSGMDAK